LKDKGVDFEQITAGRYKRTVTMFGENTDEDRAITYQLYGGDDETRIQQEMVLGIGGVRALRAAGLSPTVWHLNEGHAAFAPLELARELVVVGSDFSSALEAVAASTVFTTHTPVPAGHDRFSESLVEHYLARFAYELRLRTNELMALGELPGESGGLNMTTLAIRSSRHHNGVSKIHGHVSSEICQPCWPEISPADNPITSITNGVHVLTVLASEWVDLFDREVGTQWRAAVTDVDYWERLQGISPQQFWSTRQAIKSKMLADMRDVLTAQYTRNGMNASRMAHRLRFMDPNNPNILTVGFARRFATYKRATLLLTDVERLIRIAADAERPVVFLFAGKAHPADIPGQQLLRELHEITERPELDGRILLLEGYDLTLARRLLSGVDVWLNNPVYPLEASGTSGMKAAMNGAINLSVADGWWAEADQGDNGWTIHPSSHPDHFHRDREDAQTLYRLLEHEVVPRYYQASDDGYSPEWVVMAKRSMASVLPRFCMDRMVQEYTEQLYVPAARHGSRLNADNAGLARELANWKQRVATAWPGVAIRTLQAPASELSYGEPLRLEVAVQLGGLISQDVAVELVVTGFERTSSSIREGVREGAAVHGSHKRTYVSRFSAIEAADTEEGEARFWLEYEPPTTGRFEYQVRVYPHHDALAHPFEVGLMRWVK
ncbi:MAG: alpha-glucan family phosphorylase, partial [Gammaproteobacteria bacterium]|nr:alpha-glucan family phosphorylase [Gammaproteobacteria bacterium]